MQLRSALTEERSGKGKSFFVGVGRCVCFLFLFFCVCFFSFLFLLGMFEICLGCFWVFYPFFTRAGQVSRLKGTT